MPATIKSVVVNPAFAAFVTAIAQANGESWSATLVNAAARELGYEGVAVEKHGDGKRFHAGKRCQCGEAARFPENGITCEVCGKPMF